MPNIDLSKVSELSRLNAEQYLNDAKILAGKGKYGHAYFLLTLCIEELAKSIICKIKEIDETEIVVAAGSKRPPKGVIGIQEEKINAIFKGSQAHNEKRLTIITQYVFQLMNTFNQTVREKVTVAIIKMNPKEYPPLEALLKSFKKMFSLRNKSTYVDKDGSGPDDIKKEDYDELLKICEETLLRGHGFTSYANVPYNKTEEDIKAMLKLV